jgi:predicted dehydrogenase
MQEKTVAMIGLDTSHTVEFTKLMQHPEHRVVQGIRVAKALRFPSAFQAEEGQDKRQVDLEAMGVRMAATLEEAVEGVDAVFLEINDPALHLPYFEKVVGLGLPVFIDKPLCATTAEARRVRDLAVEHGTPAWSSSSLRFIPALAEAKAKVPSPVLAQTFGALGKAAAGSDLVWYGVHAVEMLVAALGVGANRVRAFDRGLGVTLLVDYADGRRGLVECLRGLYRYGGRLQSKDALAFFDSGSGSPYASLMTALRDFVVEGVVPVPLAEALEVTAILEAGDQSLVTGTAIEVRA